MRCPRVVQRRPRHPKASERLSCVENTFDYYSNDVVSRYGGSTLTQTLPTLGTLLCRSTLCDVPSTTRHRNGKNRGIMLESGKQRRNAASIAVPLDESDSVQNPLGHHNRRACMQATVIDISRSITTLAINDATKRFHLLSRVPSDSRRSFASR